jgi:hypothetical protein
MCYRKRDFEADRRREELYEVRSLFLSVISLQSIRVDGASLGIEKW